MNLLQTANDIDDLVGIEDSNQPYSFKAIFRGDGFFARRQHKKKLKFLKKLDPELRRVLHEGEKVVHLCYSTEYSFSSTT